MLAAFLWVSTGAAQDPLSHDWSRLYGDSNEQFGKITAVNGEYFCAAAYGYNTGSTQHIFKSANLESWTNLGVTLPSPPHIAFGSSLSGELFVSTSHEGFFASTNGVDWTSKFASGYGCASNGWESTDDGVHFTGVGGFLRGMHISYDDGGTWSNMYAGYDFHGIEWLNMTDTVFAVTYQGLFVSVDLGQTWSQTSIPNVNSGYADVQEVAGEIVVLEKDGDIWSLSNGSGVLRHSLSVSNLLMHQGDCFYSTHAGGYVWSNLELGLLLSRDEGDTWEVISSPVDGYLFGAFENDNRLVATTADGIWEISFGPIQGCLDATACNYDTLAVVDDGSCDYTCCPGPGCCLSGTYWSYELEGCVPENTPFLNDLDSTAILNSCYFDTDFDGLIGVPDLMNVLSVFGLQCGEHLVEEETNGETSDLCSQMFEEIQATYLGTNSTFKYYSVGDTLTWFEAESYAQCLTVEAHLASVHSAAEVELFTSWTAEREMPWHWIGIYQDFDSPEFSEPSGGWTWIDGSPLDFTNWAGPEPNNGSGFEHHGHMNHVNWGMGVWNDGAGDIYEFSGLIQVPIHINTWLDE